MRARKLVMMNWLCFKTLTSNLVKIAMQSPSQFFTMEMREPVVKLLKTWADCALGESLFDIFKVACKSVFMTFPLAT